MTEKLGDKVKSKRHQEMLNCKDQQMLAEIKTPISKKLHPKLGNAF